MTRGACNDCTCPQYCPPDGDARNWKCTACGHFPTKHQKLGARKMCRFRGCYQPINFDLNTGEEKVWCAEHEGSGHDTLQGNGADVQAMEVQDIEYDSFTVPPYIDETMALPIFQDPPYHCQYSEGQYRAFTEIGVYSCVFHLLVYPTTCVIMSDGSAAFSPSLQHQQLQQIGHVMAPDQIQTGVSQMTTGFPHQAVQCLVPGAQKCALVECPNPSYVDENGTVHKCCGQSHAKEHEYRLAEQCNHLPRYT